MFSIKRTFNLLVRDLYINRRAFLSVGLVLLLGFAIVEIGLIQFFGPQPMLIDGKSEPVVYYVKFFKWFEILWIVYVGLIPFIEYTKKYNRAASIVFPATQEEKFVANFLIAYLVLPIAIFVSSFLGLELGGLVNSISYDNYIILYERTFAGFASFDTWSIAIALVSIGFFGSICFKKNKVILIWVYFLAFLFVLAICVFIEASIFEGLGYTQSITTYGMLNKYRVLYYIILWAIAVYMIVLSYFRLKEERS